MAESQTHAPWPLEPYQSTKSGRLCSQAALRVSVERAIFLTVLHRLFAPGSDRAAEKWKDDYAIEGAAGLDLRHLSSL